MSDAGGSVSTPRQLLASGEGAELSAAVHEAQLPFPLVAKPLRGELHTMAVVYDEAGLRALGGQPGVHGLAPPFVLQEFINHGGTLFKVYVAGDNVTVQKRRSLPDMQLPAPPHPAADGGGGGDPSGSGSHRGGQAGEGASAAGASGRPLLGGSGLQVMSAVSRLNPWHDPEDQEAHHDDDGGGGGPGAGGGGGGGGGGEASHSAVGGSGHGRPPPAALGLGGGVAPSSSSSLGGAGASWSSSADVHVQAWEAPPSAGMMEDVEEPPAGLMAALARELRLRLGLQLFNLDVIRAAAPGPAGKPHFLVIDINYFPGYGKLPGYEAFFADFLQQQGRVRAAAT